MMVRHGVQEASERRETIWENERPRQKNKKFGRHPLGLAKAMTNGGEVSSDDESRRALEDAFREHNEGLVKFLRRRLHSEADALEASQEAYLRLLKSGEFHKSIYVKAYLFKVASNVATDMLRRRAREGRIFSRSVIDMGAEPEQLELLNAKEKLRIIERAIGDMSPKAKEAFLLSRNEGWSSEQIATHLKVTDRMVRIYLVKTLEHIQNSIGSAFSERHK